MGKKSDISKAGAESARAAKPAARKSKKAVVEAAEPIVPAAPIIAKPVKTTAKKSAPKTTAKPAYTQDDVALRAYFIAEKRQKAGLPGDAHQDWIEAERQLAAESKKKKTAAA